MTMLSWMGKSLSGASTKRCTETPGSAGQSTRARTLHHHLTMASRTLDAAKQEFKTRYEEMKRMGVRPFG
jgi:hypothetical protein